MSYEVFFTPDWDRRRIKTRDPAPDEFRGSVAELIRELKADPRKVGYEPPVSFRQVGLMASKRIKFEGITYTVYLHFQADDERKQIVVHRARITPQYKRKS